jgi:hypothetical protein
MPPAAIYRSQTISPSSRQYSLTQIIGVWALAAGPMGLLAWVVYPALAPTTRIRPEIFLWILMLVGQLWLTALSLFILYSEEGTLQLSALHSRIWWQQPRISGKDEKRKSVWLWVIPLIIASAVNVAFVGPILRKVWISFLPMLAQPSGFNIESLFSTPIVGTKWNGPVILIGLAVLQLICTYFLGEGLLFRGVLLPKMQRVFGKLDWPANGLLYAAFHLHKPWAILSAIPGGILYAEATRDHRCAWLGAIAHSVEGLFLFFLILGTTI